MAFEIKQLSAITNNKNNADGTGTPSIFAYFNLGGDTVTGAGYVPQNVGVKNNDQVQVYAQNGLAIAYYKAVADSAGVITLTAHT